MASSSAQGKKHKANTACNTCRQRKTRCDGEKPSCSYCRTTGGQCVYRVVYNESSSVTDQSVLDRLARLEARLESLDHLPSESSHGSQHFESSFPRRPFGMAMNIPEILPTIDAPNIHRNDQMPLFHTAATHKMLHYWPRVSMALTIRDIDPLKYVEETHGAGVPPLVHDCEIEVDFEVVQALLGQAEQNCTGIDYLLYDMLQRHSNILTVLRQPLSPVVSSPTSVVSKQFSCEQLLTINLAARQARNLLDGENKAVAQKIQDWSFQCANAKTAELLFKSDDESVLFLLLCAYILMSDAYPIGALKLIQAAGDRLGRCSRRPINDELWKERLYCCLKLHHIIESEILLTMDGLPSESVSAALNQISYIKTLKEVETGYVNLSVAEIAKLKLSEHISEITFAICGIQNKVLTQVYSIEQAYSRPSMLAHAISDLKSQLCAWFDALPLEWHFPRDLSSVMSMPSPATSFLRPLRIKYYIVEFLMCRPVLYYIAHESFENSADHPIDLSPGESTTSQDNHPFWVYDACYRCLQCAALLIVDEKPMASGNLGRFQRDWFEVHMIWGAALTLVVAVATPSLAKFLPKHGNSTDSMSLLNLAEEILQAASQQSGVIARCTAYLRNVKENMSNSNNDNDNHLMQEAVLDEAYHDPEGVEETIL